MNLDASVTIRDRIDDLYRTDSRRVFASLVRLLNDFDLADDGMHEAFAAAVEVWERDGVPANPRAWLISTGKFKAINASFVAKAASRNFSPKSLRESTK